MKALVGVFSVLLLLTMAQADTTITALPLGTAASTTSSDVFPFVNVGSNLTEKMTIYDIANIPAIVATYAPIASPTFTGTVNAPTIASMTVGAATFNATSVYNLLGSSSGTISILPQAASGTYNFNMPITAGTSGQLLTSAGGSSSPMTWSSISGIAITSLTGDVTGTGPGATATTAAATQNNITSIPNLATIGTVTTGVWHSSTKIGSAYGGTNFDSSGSTGVPQVNSGTWSVNAHVPASLGGTGTDTSASSGFPSLSVGTWSVVSKIPASGGGTNLDTSASTGYPSISSGTWSVASTANTFITLFETVATTAGDLIYGAASGTPTRLAANSTATKKYLQSVSSDNPSWQQVAFGDISGTITSAQAAFTQPTYSIFTSGTAQTYTVPAGAVRLRFTVVGAGGGGGASGTTGWGSSANGSATTFKKADDSITYISAGGGSGGGNGGGGGGAGGTNTVSTFSALKNFAGQQGGGWQYSQDASSAALTGGYGGQTPLGGGGTATSSAGGGNAIANTGSGGGGAGITQVTGSNYTGGGGGAGGFVEAEISASIAATYHYTVGGGGAGGSAGTNGAAGGTGAAGYILIEEYYQ